MQLLAGGTLRHHLIHELQELFAPLTFGNSTEELRLAIEAFIAAYSQNAKPFKWRKREVKGAQLRNTIVNLCN